MTRIVVLSDTHIPRRAREIPDRVWRAIESADVVFHAGDWVDTATLDELEARSPSLVGVAGNNDGAELHSRLPEVLSTTVDGVVFTIIHDSGPATGREVRTDLRFPGTDVLLFGHSHIPWDSRSPGGMRLINPGSPTDRRRQPAGTFVTAEIVESRIENVTFVTVPPRSRGSDSHPT